MINITDKEKIILFEKYISDGDYPLELKPYTKKEKKERDSLPPMYWSQRDWKDGTYVGGPNYKKD